MDDDPLLDPVNQEMRWTLIQLWGLISELRYIQYERSLDASGARICGYFTIKANRRTVRWLALQKLIRCKFSLMILLHDGMSDTVIIEQ